MSVSLTRLLSAVVLVGSLVSPSFAAPQDIERYRNFYLPDDEAVPKDGAVRVTFLGTTTLLFDDGETQILIDGFLSRPPLNHVVFRRIQTDPVVVDAIMKRAKIDRLKAIFVAHSHYDHVFDVAYIARKTGAKIYGSESTLNVGRGGEVPGEQLVLFQPGREVEVGGFTVTVFESKHSPPIPGINDDLGEVIDAPLRQPAHAKEYKEGGSFDMRIRRGERSIVVIPSTNFVEGKWENVRADVVFLGSATLGKQSRAFRDAYYAQTIGKIRPRLVVPIHWDNFFTPLSDRLEAPGILVDDLPAAFDDLIARLEADKIRFGVLQGFQGVTFFRKRD